MSEPETLNGSDNNNNNQNTAATNETSDIEQESCTMTSTPENENMESAPDPKCQIFIKENQNKDSQQMNDPESIAIETISPDSIEACQNLIRDDASFSNSDEPLPSAENGHEATSPPPLNADKLNSFFQRQAKRIARNPKTFLSLATIIFMVLGTIAMLVGDFAVEVDTIGWTTRGTLIGDRQAASMLIRFNSDYLKEEGEMAWEDLTTNIQPNWEVDRRRRRRRLIDLDVNQEGMQISKNEPRAPLAFFLGGNSIHRQLQQDYNDPNLVGCDWNLYESSSFTSQRRLWPVWKAIRKESLFSPDALYEICVAENTTQRYLEEQGLCYGCDNGKCLPPLSLVLYARLNVVDGASLSCEGLRNAWELVYQTHEDQWKECVADTKSLMGTTIYELPDSCPFGFSPSMVDTMFDESNFLTYSSSVFTTYPGKGDELYDGVGNYDRGGNLVLGAYDTQDEKFNILYQNEVIGKDALLAISSGIVIIVAVMAHTRSPFLTVVGLLQIVLSFPLSFFVYKLVAGLNFFPFLNFIGIFVIFAIGADDIFVAVDKWKNARLEHPQASIEAIAAISFPDAAGAMFLTSLTTSVAFFATAICPVAPIKLFAIFVGLLVLLDYCLCILLIFPALCIYDSSMQAKQGRPNCCILVRCSQHGSTDDSVVDDENGGKPSLIRRILSAYYTILHRFRWVLLLVSLGALALSASFAAKLELPLSLDVRLLGDSVEYEMNHNWRQELLDTAIFGSGSTAFVFWGVVPADTGDHNDPDSFSQLVLDESFDPSMEANQIDLLAFCDDLFEQDFASLTNENFECPIASFSNWLGSQKSESEAAIYSQFCNGATELPMEQGAFHACFSAWTDLTGNDYVFSRNGVITVMYLPFHIRVGHSDHYRDLKSEFSLIDDWVRGRMSVAPEGVNQGFFIGGDFWWYDTHRAMLETAMGSAAIALGAAALVILASSKSVTLTIFSSVTMIYVLASTIAAMVAAGWTLGFLESICFAILIGISADFVTHFSHAYATPLGNVERGVRTRHALIHMGPSILAAAITTAAAAVIMAFTVILFFQQFSFVLLVTIVQSTIGAFVLFCAMADCFGPSNPTYTVEYAIGCMNDILNKGQTKEKDNGADNREDSLNVTTQL